MGGTGMDGRAVPQQPTQVVVVDDVVEQSA
jgi:hypothetical protein